MFNNKLKKLKSRSRSMKAWKVVWVRLCDVVDDGVSGGEGCGKVEWLILSCFWVLIPDRQTNERTFVVVESLSRLKTKV